MDEKLQVMLMEGNKMERPRKCLISGKKCTHVYVMCTLYILA